MIPTNKIVMGNKNFLIVYVNWIFWIIAFLNTIFSLCFFSEKDHGEDNQKCGEYT